MSATCTRVEDSRGGGRQRLSWQCGYLGVYRRAFIIVHELGGIGNSDSVMCGVLESEIADKNCADVQAGISVSR
jgi:hypothetical protein